MGGTGAVYAELELIKTALSTDDYDRLTFLQGADYPIKSDNQICDFYRSHMQTEFCRACMCTGVNDEYFYDKCRYILFYNNPNLIKKAWNKLTRISKIKLRDGYVHDGEEKYPVFWGAAQWSITADCAKYILEFHDNHPSFNKWFLHAFPADELYFPTVIMNSPYRERTLMKGSEEAKRGLSNWRNLHYFEYLPGKIRVFTFDDRDFVMSREELYIRKVNTECSSELLDYIDSQAVTN